MTSLTGTTATLRRRLLGALTATGLGGATAVVLLSAPSAVGASDPCAASEMARTISNVTRSAGDYLDGHPETNHAMTSVLQQPAGPQSVDSLKSYFSANPKAASDLQTIASPLAGLSSRCQMPISLPQVLGFMQAAQGGLPEGGAAAQAVSGAQGALPAVVPGAAAVPGLSAGLGAVK
ncbi:MAG: hemophore [Mycobacterium sp.]|uniref:hemophore n=1 Tax=Mycobacterium sp. TaxID=1785 RepID=UPI003BB4D234